MICLAGRMAGYLRFTVFFGEDDVWMKAITTQEGCLVVENRYF